jgi:hypothetical protein
MRADLNSPEAQTRLASDATSLLEKTTAAMDPNRSSLGHTTSAVSAARLSVRVLPGSFRLMKRYPLASGLVIAGIICTALVLRSREAARFDNAS